MTGYENTSKQKPLNISWTLGVGLVSVWFGVIVALAANGSLALLPGESPALTLAAILGPPLIFALALFTIPNFKAWALSLDPALLTALQGWRVLGGGFLIDGRFNFCPVFMTELVDIQLPMSRSDLRSDSINPIPCLPYFAGCCP